MKWPPRYYQESVTHTAVPWTYSVGGKNFDGFYTDKFGRQHLLEAKGNYSWLLDKNGNLVPWGESTNAGIIGQMKAQTDAAKGTGAVIDWYIEGSSSAAYFQNLVQQGGWLITVMTAPGGRSNVY